MDWKRIINNLQKKYNFKVCSSLSKERVIEVGYLLKFPKEITDFYLECNGLEFGWFKILHIEDKNNIKHTWDGIIRANSDGTSKFLNNKELLEKFLVFASLGFGSCGVISRSDNTIWFEQDDELHQTTLSLEEFIEVSLKEVLEL